MNLVRTTAIVTFLFRDGLLTNHSSLLLFKTILQQGADYVAQTLRRNMSLKCLILVSNNLDPARLVVLADALVSILGICNVWVQRRHCMLSVEPFLSTLDNRNSTLDWRHWILAIIVSAGLPLLA